MQTGRIWCKVVAASPSLWERDVADTVLHLSGALSTCNWPLFCKYGGKLHQLQKEKQRCQQQDHYSGSGPADIPMSSIFWKSLAENHPSCYFRRRNDVSAALKPVLQTLKHVTGKHCRNSLARMWQWSQSVQSNSMSSKPLFLTLLSTDQIAS